MKKDRELSKLASIDEHGSKISLIPGDVRGFFRRHRTWTQIVLLIIFLGLPWTEVGGRQTVLLDISGRNFTFFGVVFKAHETPLLFFLLAIGTLGLAIVSSIWGRIWCGWACPQTVFIDGVFRRIEAFVEGSALARRQLAREPLSFRKFWKKSVKWILFLVASSLIAHSFLAYFAGSRALLKMMQGSPIENWNYFLLVSAFTALVLFDFAWFREQFCVIMCPYGRIQSVLLEPSSLAVVYEQDRGEPRRGENPPGVPPGDCVSCGRCVQVCPTGIDIRLGLQMECIACTACIDACDEIMEKVKKPKGLIRYRTLDGSPFRLFKIKSVAYGLLILVALVGLIYNLQTRDALNITWLRGLEAPFSLATNSEGLPIVVNHFRLHLNSQSFEDATYRIDGFTKETHQPIEIAMAENPIVLKADASQTWHIFIKVPQAHFTPGGQYKMNIVITELQTQHKWTQELILLGPQK